MTSRVARIGRAACLGLLVSCVSSAGFAVESDNATKTSECLSGPKGAAPQGERWYYRVERNTKKHCWYTRAGTPRNVATQTPAPAPVQVADENPPATLQPSVANARAEVATPVFPPPPAALAPPAPAPAMNSTTDAQNRTLADRFSDHPDADEPAKPLPAGVAQPMPQTASTKAATDQGTSLGLMLIMIGGALALVGIAVALIKQFARPRTQSRPDDLWSRVQHDDDDQTEPSPPLSREDDEPSMNWDGPPMNWVRIAREEADRRDDEIQHVLSRPARPAV